MSRNLVKEFHNIEQLQVFLDRFNLDSDTPNPIKKVFRSPDGVYFVWYIE